MNSEAARRFTDDLMQRAPDDWNFPLTFIMDTQEIYDRSQPNISASEALYAFFGHLCNLPDPIVLSKKHNPVRIHDLIEKFCKLNNIPDPEPGWEKRLNPLFYKETMKMNGECVMHAQPLSLCPECRDNAIKNAMTEKGGVTRQLRETLIGISVEDCDCRWDKNHGVKGKELYQCPRCRALEILEETKGK